MAYRKAGYSKKFREEHEEEILSKNRMRQGNYYSSLMAEVIFWWLQNAI